MLTQGFTRVFGKKIWKLERDLGLSLGLSLGLGRVFTFAISLERRFGSWKDIWA